MADSYYDLLGVPQRASTREIRQAHERLTAEASAASRGKRRVTALTLLDDALRVLSNEDQRNAYDQALKDAAEEAKPTMMSVVAGVMTKGAVPMPGGSTTDDLPSAGESDPAPAIASEDLDWSGWHQGFSLRLGRMNLGVAVVAGLLFDVIYSMGLVSVFGSSLSARVYLPLFLLSIVTVPAVAALKGRHWFFWAVVALGGGLLAPMFPNHGPFSHVVLAAVLFAQPGKPRCPNCEKLMERFIAECTHCHVDLRAQPL